MCITGTNEPRRVSATVTDAARTDELVQDGTAGVDPDAETVRRARTGDQGAFEQLVLNHQRRTFNVACRILGDYDEALDLTQEVFIQAHRSLGQFRGEELAADESSAVAGADDQDRYRGTPAASVERVAPTELKASAEEAEQLQPSQIEVVCLLPPDGDTVEDLTRLLRSEGAINVATSVLEPPAVHEAFAPHRLRLASLPEPSHGWAVTALVPPRALTRLLDTLTSRTSLRILEQPQLPTAPDDPAAGRELHITVLR